MPFSAVINNSKIYSFKIKESEWEEYKKDKSKYFSMNCCSSKAILKTSKFGTQFFAHSPKSDCNLSVKESIEHQYCKYIIAKTLHSLGWNVEAEKSGETPTGKKWFADIFAEKNNSKVCIEVQWSPQTAEETDSRTQVYEESGLKCLWFVRIPRMGQKYDFELDEILEKYNHKSNVLFLNKEKDNSFSVSGFKVPVQIQTGNSSQISTKFQSIELSSFLKLMLKTKTIRKLYASQLEKYITISYYQKRCHSCAKFTNIVSGVQVFTFIDNIRWKLADFPIYRNSNASFFNDESVQSFLNSESNVYKFGRIKSRYSATRKQFYVSSGCYNCDALMGNFYIPTELKYSKVHQTSLQQISLIKYFNNYIFSAKVWYMFES